MENQVLAGNHAIRGADWILAGMQWIPVLVGLLPLKVLPWDGDMAAKEKDVQILKPDVALIFQWTGKADWKCSSVRSRSGDRTKAGSLLGKGGFFLTGVKQTVCSFSFAPSLLFWFL